MFSVTRGGRTTQGWSSFASAVDEVVLAHESGQPWSITVRDKIGPRVPTEAEGAKLVSAVVKALEMR